MAGTTTEDTVANSYTITITPDDTSNPSATLRINLGTTGARVTEMTVRAGDGDGFLPDELPGFDLSRLMRAITPATTNAPIIEAPATAHTYDEPAAVEAVHIVAEAAAPPARASAPAKASAPARKRAAAKKGAAATKSAAAGTATPRKNASRSVGTRASARKAAATAPAQAPTSRATKAAGRAATKTAGKAAAKSARTARSAAGNGRRSATKAAGATKAGRAYRRTPTDIVEVFNQAGSVTALANHYAVPRHTAQGWVRRLRQEGTLPASR
jgi:hypothetical protein